MKNMKIEKYSKKKKIWFLSKLDKCNRKIIYWNILNNLTPIKFPNTIYNIDMHIANWFNSFFTTIGININDSFKNTIITLNTKCNSYYRITNDNNNKIMQSSFLFSRLNF